MQFDFNHPERLLHLQPLHRLSQLSCLCVVLVLLAVNSGVHGQRLDHLQYQILHQQGFSPQPRHFGDTPSPTEMMARLKLHKQQETPLFDLLREAGDDIFSKLSDDEKKLAGRFVEDMILKEGMDSDRVSSLMEHMNISDAAKQALQDGIERAGGESAISPEDRKKLANQIRKDFLQQSGNRENIKSATNGNWRQSNQSSDSPSISPLNTGQNPLNSDAEQIAGDLGEPLDEKIKSLQRLVDEIRKQNPTESGRQQKTVSEDELKLLRRKLIEETKRAEDNQQFPRGEKIAGNTNRSNRAPSQNAGEQNTPSSRQSDIASNNQPQSPRDTATAPRQSTASPDKQALNKLLTQEAFRQLEKQLSEPQQKIVSELKDKIQSGNVTQQEIEDLFSDLQSFQSPDDLAKQLDEVGKSIGLPADSREEVQEALSQLSDDQRRSLQETIDGVSKQMLSDLLGRADKEKSSPGSSASSSRQTASSPNANTDGANNSQLEDVGREFLQDALETYNDPESGYKLSDAFQRLKDQAEGITSDRELANLGNLSKKLLEDSSKIFDSNSTSEARKKRGVKPGQRFDQLIASAANKALEDNGKRDKQEGDSVLSGVLNQALSVAIDQAVTAADNGLENRNRDVPQDWNESSDLSYFDNSNWQDQLDLSEDEDGNFQPYDSASSPTTNNFSNNTNSSESSLQDSAASLGDAFSDLKINWQTVFYGIGLIAILSVGIYILSQLMQPASEEELKQRELKRKLKSSSVNSKDLVEAVDLFLLSRFGAASSWWNAKHAATQISNAQPDWRDKVASLFQIYRWSRYQADGQTSVSPEQNDLVKSTLRELSQVPIESFNKTKSSQNEAQDVTVDAEEKS